jgi:carboxymethylenebutenolidase
MTKTNLTIHGTNAYSVKPDDGTVHPSLIVIEEIWGLTDHIKDVADRFAAAGYNVLAPELLPAGLLELLTPQFQHDLFDPEKRSAVQPLLREAMAPLHQPEFGPNAIAILRACIDHLLADTASNGAVGVVGFCFGGTYSFQLAAHDDRIKAAVPFYGQPPTVENINSIHCPILAFYGDKDTNLMESLPTLKTDLTAAQKAFELVVYEGTGHAFFNDTNAHAYNAEYAADAWKRTLSFLTANLA